MPWGVLATRLRPQKLVIVVDDLEIMMVNFMGQNITAQWISRHMLLTIKIYAPRIKMHLII
jgi:hypothetical protein